MIKDPPELDAAWKASFRPRTRPEEIVQKPHSPWLVAVEHAYLRREFQIERDTHGMPNFHEEFEKWLALRKIKQRLLEKKP